MLDPYDHYAVCWFPLSLLILLFSKTETWFPLWLIINCVIYSPHQMGREYVQEKAESLPCSCCCGPCYDRRCVKAVSGYTHPRDLIIISLYSYEPVKCCHGDAHLHISLAGSFYN